jgi:uncharacterized protein
MNLRDSFIHLHPLAKILISFTLAFVGLLASQIINALIIWLLPEELLGNSFNLTEINTGVLKVIQIVSSIGVFLIPAYIIAYISTPDPLQYLRLKHKINRQDIYLVVILVISSIPIINLLSLWNSGLNLPDSMDKLEFFIQQMECSAAAMQERMLNVDTVWGVAFNILVIAFFPAIAEEFFFRGVIQKQLKIWTKNVHIAVIVTGILFSFAHFQFLGFLPRMFLGIILGYLMVYSRNIWIPIFAHFLNNAMAVVAYYFYFKTDKSFNPDELGTSWDSPFLYVSIILFFLAGFYFIRKKRQRAL